MNHIDILSIRNEIIFAIKNEDESFIETMRMIKKYEKMFFELNHQKPTVLKITDKLKDLLHKKETVWRKQIDEEISSLVDVAFRKFEIEKLYQNEDCFVFTVR